MTYSYKETCPIPEEGQSYSIRIGKWYVNVGRKGDEITFTYNDGWSGHGTSEDIIVNDHDIVIPMGTIVQHYLKTAAPEDIARSLWEENPEVRRAFTEHMAECYSNYGGSIFGDTDNERIALLAKMQIDLLYKYVDGAIADQLREKEVMHRKWWDFYHQNNNIPHDERRYIMPMNDEAVAKIGSQDWYDCAKYFREETLNRIDFDGIKERISAALERGLKKEHND